MASTLTRWEPFGELAELRGRLDQVFADLTPGLEHRWSPAVDVVRSNGNIVMRADIPGMKPDEVKIEIENDLITIKGEHGEQKEEKGEHYVRRERRWGSFERSMPLPSGVDPKKVEAKTRNGVLEVTIPLPGNGEGAVTITPTGS